MKRWLIGFIVMLMICLPVTVFAQGDITSFSATATEDGAYIDIMVMAAKDITGVKITKGSSTVGSPGNIGAGDSWSGGCEVDGNDRGQTVTLKLTYTGSDGETHSQTTTVAVPGENTTTAEATTTTAPADETTTPADTSATTPVNQGTASATVFVSADDTRVKQGENVKLTYVVTNTGDKVLNYVELSEPSLGKINSTENVQPGEKLTFTYTIKNINQSFESKPRLTFVADGKTQAVSGNTVNIKVTTAKLTVTLEVSKTQIDAGESVTLSGRVTNRGDLEFEEVVIAEKTLGELETTGKMDYGDSKTITKEVTPEDSAVYQLVVTAKDRSGKKYTYSSKSVTVKVADHPVPVTIDLSAQTDTVQLSEPGMVSFSIDVDNISNRPLENVEITDQNNNTVQMIDELPVGTRNIQYECMVNTTTEFIFTATVKFNGVTSNFRSAPVKVTIAEQVIADTSPTTLATTTTTVMTSTAAPLPNVGSKTLTKVLIGIVIVIAIIITALIALVIYGNSIRPDTRRKTVGRKPTKKMKRPALQGRGRNNSRLPR